MDIKVGSLVRYQWEEELKQLPGWSTVSDKLGIVTDIISTPLGATYFVQWQYNKGPYKREQLVLVE